MDDLVDEDPYFISSSNDSQLILKHPRIQQYLALKNEKNNYNPASQTKRQSILHQ